MTGTNVPPVLAQAKDDSGGLMVGTEHEYSINDPNFKPLAVNDQLIKALTGEFHIEAPFGGICLGKELQKHVLEMRTIGPHTDLGALEREMTTGMAHVNRHLGPEFKFLGLGMQPLLKLEQTAYWDHDEKEYFDEFHRVFGLKKHGWLNIQALQVNFPYGNEADLVKKFNRVRSIIPYLVAVTAASPFVEGEKTGHMDNRIIFYRENQKKIPLICNEIIPEKLNSQKDYEDIQDRIYMELRKEGAELLCSEWVNSRGVIIRFSRRCLEIKAMDEQECIHSDMAVTAFIRALLRVKDLPLEDDRVALLELNQAALDKGTAAFRPELQKLYDIAFEHAYKDDKPYLPLIKRRIDEGSLAELMAGRAHNRDELMTVLDEMAMCLRDNKPYVNPT